MSPSQFPTYHVHRFRSPGYSASDIGERARDQVGCKDTSLSPSISLFSLVLIAFPALPVKKGREETLRQKKAGFDPSLQKW